MSLTQKTLSVFLLLLAMTLPTLAQGHFDKGHKGVNHDSTMAVKMLESTGKLIVRAEEAVKATNEAKAIEALTEAKKNYDNGAKLVGEKKYKEAITALRTAEMNAYSAIRLAKTPMNKDSLWSAKMVESVGKLIEKADAAVKVTNEPKAVEALTEARKHYDAGKALHGQKNYKDAMKELRNAENYAYKAIWLSKSTGNRDSLIAVKMAESVKKLIDKADAAVKVTNEPKAVEALALANTHYQNALTAIAGKKFKEAIPELREATKYAYTALRLAKGPSNKDSVIAVKMLESVTKLVAKAEVAVNASKDPKAIEALTEATKHLAAGKQLVTDKKYKEAIVELREAAKYAFKAMKFAKGEGITDSAKVAKLIEKVGKELERAKVIVDSSKNVKAIELLAQANDHFTKAKGLFGDKKYSEAKAELREAAILAAKAVYVAKSLTPEQVKTLIDRVGKEIEDAKVIVNPSTNEKAKELLAKAIEHYTKAVDLNTKGETNKAVFQVKMASQLAHRAVAMVKSEDPKYLEELLKKASDEIAAAKPVMDTTTNEKAKKLYEKGKEYYAKAVELQTAKKIKEGIIQAKFAIRFVKMAVKVAK